MFDTSAIRGRDGIEVWFDQGTIELRDGSQAQAGGILAALGIGVRDMATDDDLSIASPGTPRLLVPVRSRRSLRSLQPDLDRLTAECRQLGYLGCFVYVPPTTPERTTGNPRSRSSAATNRPVRPYAPNTATICPDPMGSPLCSNDPLR